MCYSVYSMYDTTYRSYIHLYPVYTHAYVHILFTLVYIVVQILEPECMLELILAPSVSSCVFLGKLAFLCSSRFLCTNEIIVPVHNVGAKMK